MINLPVKDIPITKFELKKLSSCDYNFNSEFEQSYKKQFETEFRVVEFELPEDAEVLSCRYFQLRGEKLFTFQEFTKYDKKDHVIRFVCQADNWEEVTELNFCYFYITEELVQIRNEINQLEETFIKEVSELNKHIFEVNGTILSHE